MLKLLHELPNKLPNFDVSLINQHFDARGLSCPMPLLKTKVLLRDVPLGEGLYLIASDKNSQTDLVAFCQKQSLTVHTWAEGETYHFVIVK